MKAWVKTDGNGRIEAFSFDSIIVGGMLLDVPADLDLNELHQYAVVDGKIVKDGGLP